MDAIELYTHSQYSYDDKRRCFVRQNVGVPASGVCPTLKKLFFKNYRYNRKQIEGSPAHAPASEYPKFFHWCTTTPKKKSTAKIRTGKQGQARGRRIDRQLVWLFDDDYLEIARRHGRISGYYRHQGRPKQAHAYTKHLKKYLDSLGLIPVAVQVVVGHAQLATAVDLVCRRKDTMEYVCCEIKSGYHHGYFHGSSPSRRDSPYWQHQWQLYSTVWLFSQTFGKNKPLSNTHFVFLVNDHGVFAFPLMKVSKDTHRQFMNRLQYAFSQRKR